MNKITRAIEVQFGRVHQYHIFCPGCGEIHALSPDIHHFNRDFEKPTFTPSLVIDFVKGKRCHSWISGGVIKYLGDSDHKLKSQMAQLPEIMGYYKGRVGSVQYSEKHKMWYGILIHCADIVVYESKTKEGLYDAFTNAVDAWKESTKTTPSSN
jgi:hypothetical protein